MSICSCRYKCNCTTAALIVSLIVGIIGAFFQITGMITVTPTILWILSGIALVFLGLLLLSTGMGCERRGCLEICRIVNTVLVGILGTVLIAAVLLAVGIVATSVISAILVGILLFFFSLILTTLACYIRCVINCGE